MDFKTFVASENGAVTVDWVVLTAAIVGLGLATMAVVSGGVEDLSGDIDTQLVSMDIGSMYDWTDGGVFGLLHFDTEQEAADHVEDVLANLYGGNHQDYYEAAYHFATLEGNGNAQYETDVLAAVMAQAEADGVTLDTEGDMTFEEIYAMNAES
ncbi:hypothetical protein [[Roseibacterium] beibuensis]